MKINKKISVLLSCMLLVMSFPIMAMADEPGVPATVPAGYEDQIADGVILDESGNIVKTVKGLAFSLAPGQSYFVKSSIVLKSTRTVTINAIAGVTSMGSSEISAYAQSIGGGTSKSFGYLSFIPTPPLTPIECVGSASTTLAQGAYDIMITNTGSKTIGFVAATVSY